MTTEELKVFERMSEGVVLFNEDGTFDYVNAAGSDLLWTDENDDQLYESLSKLINKVIKNYHNKPFMVELKNLRTDFVIKCSVSKVNGYYLVVLGDGIDDHPRGFGMPSPVGLIRNQLCLMTTIYVGGGLMMANYSHMSGVMSNFN